MTARLLPDARVTGPGEGFESLRVGETGSVVADLGEHPGAGERPESWEAGDDLGVRVRFKRLHRSSGQVVCAGAGGIELSEQGDGLAAHGLFDLRELPHLRCPEGLADPFGLCLMPR